MCSQTPRVNYNYTLKVHTFANMARYIKNGNVATKVLNLAVWSQMHVSLILVGYNLVYGIYSIVIRIHVHAEQILLELN